MNNVVIFRLKRHWKVDEKTIELYEEIKAGRKTSEWRNASPYWLRKLLTNRLTKEGLKYVLQVRGYNPQELTTLLKVHRAWFTVGYPKGNVPRLETDITALIYHRESGQLEIKIASVVEITVKSIQMLRDCNEVRKILTRPVSLKRYDPKVQEALEHLLKCDSCFVWSFQECEKIRTKRVTETPPRKRRD